MSELDLDAVEARSAEADDGPWEYQKLPWGRTVIAGGEGFILDIADHLRNERTAEFIAHARTDVPALVARVRELKAEVAALRGDPHRRRTSAEWAAELVAAGDSVGVAADEYGVTVEAVRAAVEAGEAQS